MKHVPDSGRFDVIHGRVPDDGRKRKLLFTSVRAHDKYTPWYDTTERLVSGEKRWGVLESLCAAREQGEYWVEDPHFKNSHLVGAWHVTKQEFEASDHKWSCQLLREAHYRDQMYGP